MTSPPPVDDVQTAAHMEDVRKQVISAFHDQSAFLQRAVDGVNHLCDVAATIASQARACESQVQEMSEESAQGVEDAKALIALSRDLGTVQQRMRGLATAVENIRTSLLAIEDIAMQSNILAINASIESAHAGEAGKGFAVVAQSMRELSKQSATAASKIGEVVETSVADIVTIVDTTGELLERNQAIAVATESRFRTIDDAVGAVCGATTRIVEAAARDRAEADALQSSLLTASEDQARAVGDLIGAITGTRVEEVDPRDVSGVISEFVVVDVRREDEYHSELGRIDGAVLATLGDDLERFLATADRHANYLFVCRRGGRSARACRLALQSGFLHITNLAGGMEAWNDARLPIELSAAAE